MPFTFLKPPLTVPLKLLKIWVLIPFLESEDPNIKYYNDFSQSLDEFGRVFKDLEIDWKWQPVTMENFRSVIDQINTSGNGKSPLVLNLCDGDEINGTPGVSVVKYLEEKGLCYSGADALFYDITTSKVTMKQAFEKAGVLTPAWEIIENKEQSVNGIFDRLGSPLIIKPAISGGSMGVSLKSVVHTEKELQEQIRLMYCGYHGWQLSSGGLLAEQFIKGREFTTLIVGSPVRPENCIHYLPVERVFHPSLPETEKFLSFDRLWEFYEKETPMPDEASFFEYFLPDENLIQPLQQITLDAYAAVGGTGYARLDIRMDLDTKKLYVLEVNAQCGLSDDEDYTSIGAILRLSRKSFSSLILEIIQDALMRKSN